MASLFAKFNKLCLLNFIVFLYFLCFTATISATTTSTASAMTKPRRFVINLIHHDSTLSPHYNPNATIKDRAKRALKSSMARLAYLHAKTGFFTDSIGAGLLPEDNLGGFAANIPIGEPPVPQLLRIDTSSNLLWLQCLPCTKCFEQKGPIFDPSKSSTYTTLQCTSPSCSISPSDKCDQSNNCKFSLDYRDGTRLAGLLGTEKLTLETSDEGISPVSDVVFGCAHDNDYDNTQASGILALGPSDISLTTHFGSKFSYCIGRIRDPTYPHNQLVLGDGAKIEGTSTSLQAYNGLYYVRPESISLAERRLVIDPEIFKRPLAGPGGTIIDSGTAFTFLVKSAYDVVIAEVQKLFDGKLEKVLLPDFPSLLCYKGSISHDLIGFPILVINFEDGADLGLDTESLFLQVSDKEFCMAVQEDNELNIIGIMAQQGYNVAYDVAGNQLYFQSIDCALLDD